MPKLIKISKAAINLKIEQLRKSVKYGECDSEEYDQEIAKLIDQLASKEREYYLVESWEKLRWQRRKLRKPEN